MPVEGLWRADLRRLLASAFLRATATGLGGVLLGVHLAAVAPGQAAGAIVTAGLAGTAGAALVTTLVGDRLGRRRTLVVLPLLGAAGAAAFLSASSPLAMGIAACLGMLNGMGRDRGAALLLEQAALPSTTDDAGRTRAFAWYNVLQDVGHALGSLLAGVVSWVQRFGYAEEAGRQAGFGLYIALLLACLPVVTGLTRAVERGGGMPLARDQRQRTSARTRRLVAKISALFLLDSLGGGFLTTALLTFFFVERFGVSAQAAALLFMGARLLNAVSHLGAAWLAQRIGLVNTMVWTHLPSSLLLATAAYAPSFPVAAVLFLLREGLVEMDVPTRQSYVVAVVEPHERTFASGVTQVVRLAAWAVAPAFAGWLLQHVSLGAPLLAGAGLKIVYDLALWTAFRHVRPPEER
ncbi:MAG TPA: MFS transporter [Candidatus Polarisedimenticolaceae bacterium]|nr:MFS transporter [Candidatus Polarisedimenticolaceae bacterium]